MRPVKELYKLSLGTEIWDYQHIRATVSWPFTLVSSLLYTVSWKMAKPFATMYCHFFAYSLRFKSISICLQDCSSEATFRVVEVVESWLLFLFREAGITAPFSSTISRSHCQRQPPHHCGNKKCFHAIFGFLVESVWAPCFYQSGCPLEASTGSEARRQHTGPRTHWANWPDRKVLVLLTTTHLRLWCLPPMSLWKKDWGNVCKLLDN